MRENSHLRTAKLIATEGTLENRIYYSRSTGRLVGTLLAGVITYIFDHTWLIDYALDLWKRVPLSNPYVQGVLIASIVGISRALLWLKTNHLSIYGWLELVAALVVSKGAIDKWSDNNPVATLATTIGTIYFLVRAFENISKAQVIKQTSHTESPSV